MYINQHEGEKKIVVPMQIKLNALEGLLNGHVLKTFPTSLDVVKTNTKILEKIVKLYKDLYSDSVLNMFNIFYAL